jgi:excisionase family DNA binding protein
MNSQPDKLWTIEEVADLLQVKPSVIKYWVQISEIPFVKLGKQYRFDQKDIKHWLERRKNRRLESDELKQVS